MTPAQFAIVRHMLGYTLQGLADALGVQVRSLQRWESGERPITDSVATEVRDLIARHTQDALNLEQRVSRNELTRIDRTHWNMAVAARVLSKNPSARFEWTNYK